MHQKEAAYLLAEIHCPRRKGVQWFETALERVEVLLRLLLADRLCRRLIQVHSGVGIIVILGPCTNDV